jgi:2-dehydro-3-deoxygalactonokinase
LSDQPTPALIGIDWGTTSFRAYLLSANGQIIETVDTTDGISSCEPGCFEDQLLTNIQRWQGFGPLPILMSGMITSRNGWLETPYLHAPAGAPELAASLHPVPGQAFPQAWFITGLVCLSNAHYPDVVRGEETEIIGHLAGTGQTDADYLLPGTHSKWLQVRNARVTGFTTSMTGDVYAALRHHTILGTTMQDGEFNRQAFERGVQTAATNDNLLATVFSARTLSLFNQLAADEGADYLSGLLIGYEVNRQLQHNRTDKVTIIGRGSLCERYTIALSMAGQASQAATSGQVARGHLEIARRAGIIQ